uniref:C2H2-type domain-containing protein n=1 Tax=Hydatigena taeniaeformis TaxID=6205 RepID=A0A0R3WPX2_HYDTA
LKYLSKFPSLFPDAYTPPDEAIYRSNANLSTSGLGDAPSTKLSHPHPSFFDTSELLETTPVPRPETPISCQHHHHHPPAPVSPPTPSPVPLQTTATPSIMMMPQCHPQQSIICSGMDKRMPPEAIHDSSNLEWRNAVQRHPHVNGPDNVNSSVLPDMQQAPAPPSLQSLPPGRPTMSTQQSHNNPAYQQHHSSPLPTPLHHHQQQPPPPPPSIQSNPPPPLPQPPPPPPPPPPQPLQSSNSASVPPDLNINQGSGGSGNGGNVHGPLGTPPPSSGSSGPSEPTTVVTFFVCEVCASRYRSTAGLRYHYHSQHAGYTPRNPISASASRISIPTSEYNRFAPNTGPRGGRNGRNKRSRSNYPSYRSGGTNKGRGMSAANQQIVNQRNASQTSGDGSESDPYHMPSANTPEEPHPRSVYSSSSEPQQTESSLSSVNSSSYISPIKLKPSNDVEYSSSSSRGKPYSGYPPPPPPPPPASSGHQPPPPPYDQHPYYGAPSALASMDHMASSLLRQQQHQQHQQQPLHSLLAQLHPTSYKPYGDASCHYYASQQRPYNSGKPSFVELKNMLRHRRVQYSADAFTCGYCQTHVEGGGGSGGGG